MADRSDEHAEAADSLPAYTDAAPDSSTTYTAPATTATTTSASPPDYRQAGFTPYVPIPDTLYGVSKTAYRGLSLCSQNPGRGGDGDRLFHAVFHTGLSGSGPLGRRPGVQLHNGVDGKAPVLAAAGSRTQPLTMRESLGDLTSVVLLPPVAAAPQNGQRKAVVRMAERGFTEVLMEPSGMANGGPVFRLRVEVGSRSDRLRPATFAWCRIPDDDGDEDGDGDGLGGAGFQLLRRVFQHGEPPAEGQRPRCAFPKTEEELAAAEDAGVPPARDDAEVVAVMRCARAPLVKAWGRQLRLEMRGGTAAAGFLGERCRVMVLATALGVYWLHVQGKTSRTVTGKAKGKGKKTKGGGKMEGAMEAASAALFV